MLRTRKFPSVVALTVGVLLLLPGCGGKKGATVKGTYILPAGFDLKDNYQLQIMLEPEGGKGQGDSADVKVGDKSFEFKGPGAKGMAPGKYKITLNFMPAPDMASGKPPDMATVNRLREINKPYTSQTTLLKYEVTDEPTQEIIIDLSKPTPEVRKAG
jgi:hypothetical protein